MQDPTLEQLGDMPGYTLLEFGASWCTYCQAAQPLIAEAMHLRNDIRHVRIEDGKGKRLGRQFKVTENRGVPIDSDLAKLVTATIHPSAVLRSDDREAMFAGLVADLRIVAEAVN